MYELDNPNAAGTEAQAIIDLAEKVPATLPGDPPGLVALGGNIVDFRHMLPATEVQAVRRASSLTAFVDLVTRLATPNSAVFAERSIQTIGAVIDFSETGSPSRDEHRVTYRPELHPDWVAWARINGDTVDQVSFAEFIEEHLDTVTQPAGADLLELVQDLRGHRNVEFQTSRRLSDGQTQLQYIEKIEARTGTPKTGATGLVTVPSDLTLSMPIFRDGAPRTLTAFLRFRISSEGALTFTVKIKKVDDVIPEAFAELVAAVDAVLPTGVHIYDGWHE